MPDVFTYEKIPQPLRVQIVHILRDTIGNENEYADDYAGTRRAYEIIVETLCREYGVFTLVETRVYGARDFSSEIFNFLLQEQNPEKVLDAIELSFRV